MSASDLVQVIALTHLLQPPLTWVLSGRWGMNLRSSVVPTTPVAAAVVTNMGVASVLLPTSLGTLLACYPTLVFEPGPARGLAAVLSAFWCWRLYRQIFVLSPLWPSAPSAVAWMNALLSAIFTVQGPGLGLVVLLN